MLVENPYKDSLLFERRYIYEKLIAKFQVEHGMLPKAVQDSMIEIGNLTNTVENESFQDSLPVHDIVIHS